MILTGILWLLLWPALIFASYQVIRIVLNKYNSVLEEVEEEETE